MVKKIRNLFKVDKIWQKIFLAYIFLLPIQTVWLFKKSTINGQLVDYWSFGLFATDIVLIIAIAIFLITLDFIKTNKIRTISAILIISILVVLFFSLYWAEDRKISIYYLFQVLKGIIVLLLILKTNIKKINIYWSLLLAGVIQSIIAISQFAWQKIPQINWLGMSSRSPSDLGVAIVETSDRVLRAYGTFNSPNILGGFLLICILFGIILYTQQAKKSKRIIIILSTILCSMGIFFSFSRAAWIALGISIILILVYLFIQATNKKRFKVLEISLVIVFIFGIFSSLLPNLVATRIKSEAPLEKNSIIERTDQYKQAINLLKDNWDFGIGLGNYTKEIQKLEPKLNAWDYQPVHNTYLLSLIEIGVLGWMLFILFIILLIKSSVKSPIKFGVMIALIFLLAFDHYFWTQEFGIVLFWLVAAMILQKKVKLI